ncbi:MAG TPA: tetratricopeptide repeat protein, partial [Stellaceae bacterium]|nr:tetratricopeptide repeat protein [Stellaceae bacterium]
MIAIATARPELAESSLAEALALAPREPAIHNGIALLRAMQGRFAETLAAHDRALAIDANDVGALIGRALAAAELGDLAAAEHSLRRARAIAPRSPDALRHHAAALTALGQREEAAGAYRELVALDPRDPMAALGYAALLADLGRSEEAVRQYERALAHDPGLAAVRLKLVELLCGLGRAEEALVRAREGMRVAPAARETAEAFALAVARRIPTEHDPEIVAGIERCFATPGIDYGMLAKPAARQLRARYDIDAAPVERAEAAVAALLREEVPPLLADGLLALLLARTVNRDAVMERFLTAARRRLAFAESLPATAHPFLAGLALQCFNNNYVFGSSEEEVTEPPAPEAAPNVAFEGRLLRYALYAPLASLAGAAALAEIALDRWSPHLHAVIERTLLEPLEEREIAETVPSLGSSEDATSQAVGRQYEEHPYPRWLTLPQQPRTRLAAALQQRFSHAEVPEFLDGPLEILIAGAGTGIQPITTALALEEVEVLAVDLSRASLAYGARMARRLGARNVKFLQGDLLRLGELGRSFPVIEVVGVLHHLQSPIAGWRVLAGMLRQGGWMRVGLYSEAARAEVVAARARIAALGLSPAPADIRRFRERVLFGSEAAQFPKLALSNDIWDLSGCRDLLFHACEHRFTLPQLKTMLGELDLDFVGFEHEVAAIPRRYRADFPDDPKMTDLDNWAAFEAAHPDAFPMYVFWCAKR